MGGNVGDDAPAADVIAYADMLTDFADRLRELAAEPAAAQADDHATRSDRT